MEAAAARIPAMCSRASWCSDHPAGPQVDDLLGGIAEPLQHGVGVLTELRRRKADLGWRGRELDRVAEGAPPLALAIGDLEHHLAMVHLPLAQHLGSCRDRPDAALPDVALH